MDAVEKAARAMCLAEYGETMWEALWPSNEQRFTYLAEAAIAALDATPAHDKCSTCGASDPKANMWCSNSFHVVTPTETTDQPQAHMTREKAMRAAAASIWTVDKQDNPLLGQSIAAGASHSSVEAATAGAEAELTRVCEWLMQGPYGSLSLWARVKLCWWLLVAEKEWVAGVFACIADALAARNHWPKEIKDGKD